MEANYGILSIIPAVIVIGLSLYTKKTIMSLMIGTFIGVTILSGWNPLVAVVAFFRDFMYPNLTSVGNLKTDPHHYHFAGLCKNAQTDRCRRGHRPLGKSAC